MVEGHHCETFHIQRALKDLTEEDFQQCFQGWTACYQQCVGLEGKYIEIYKF
jgi:hypothetical protein